MKFALGLLSLASNFFILSQLQAFVKNFFRDFSIFSEALAKAFRRDPLRFRCKLSYFITAKSVCQGLFSVLFKLFRPLSTEALRSAQLIQFTTSSSLCQELFQGSANFLKCDLSSKALSARPDPVTRAALADSFDIVARRLLFVNT